MSTLKTIRENLCNLWFLFFLAAATPKPNLCQSVVPLFFFKRHRRGEKKQSADYHSFLLELGLSTRHSPATWPQQPNKLLCVNRRLPF
jgi:hypothetical protein